LKFLKGKWSNSYSLVFKVAKISLLKFLVKASLTYKEEKVLAEALK